MVGADRAGRLLILTLLTMIAFAANSILCRLALETTPIDPASFTLVRLASGAATLWLIVRVRTGGNALAGSWAAAFSLFAYAAAFSFAYVSLSAGTGALIGALYDLRLRHLRPAYVDPELSRRRCLAYKETEPRASVPAGRRPHEARVGGIAGFYSCWRSPAAKGAGTGR